MRFCGKIGNIFQAELHMVFACPIILAIMLVVMDQRGGEQMR